MFQAGVEQTISLTDGRSFTLGKLTVGIIRAWRDWIANRIGDPFEVCERFMGKVPEAISIRQLQEAEKIRDQLKYFSLACPLAREMLSTEEGGAKLFQLLLQVKHPAATEDDGLAILIHLSGEAPQVLAVAEGTNQGNARSPA